MKIEAAVVSATEVGLPLPIATHGKVIAVYNKGRLLQTYEDPREARIALDHLVKLKLEIDEEIENGR